MDDFVDTSQEDSLIEIARHQCNELDPLVNRPGSSDTDAITRLEAIVKRLRAGRV
jgi:hypothetical protein